MLSPLPHRVCSISYKVMRAWRVHALTARKMRLEMIQASISSTVCLWLLIANKAFLSFPLCPFTLHMQAHASQLALDQHLRRVRVRLLSAVLYGWSTHCLGKARRRFTSRIAGLAYQYRRGFDSWRSLSSERARRLGLDEAATWHAFSSSLALAFGKWGELSMVLRRHANVFCVLLERHNSGVMMLALRAWRGRLVQANTPAIAPSRRKSNIP